MEKKGQFSIEYLVITAFGIIAVTVMAFLLYSQFTKQTAEVDMTQMQKFGNTLIDTISKLNYMGGSSSLTLTGNFPGKFVNATVENNRTLIFWYRDDSDTISPVEFRSPVDVRLDFTNYNKGKKTVSVQSKESYTLVCLMYDSNSCDGICEYTLTEDASTRPSDCCRSDCTGCTNDARPSVCASDGTQHPECKGLNGCV
jgi:hypothetical protein